MNNLQKLALPAFLFAALTSAQSQIPAFPLTHDGLVINRPVQPVQPFTVAGTSGVLVGTQDGQFESWILPVKLLSHLTMEANLEGYSVPIPVNPQSAQIEVRPDHTTITYAHLGFTIRQIMFSPDAPAHPDESRETSAPQPAPKTGPVVLFQIEANHPLDLTFRFTPEMRWMWPKRNEGIPSPEWVSASPSSSPTAAGVPPSAQGYYLLHLDYNDLTGAITIPTATPGILAPYQERPQVHPLELHLHYDPKRDGDKYFPLLMAVGTTQKSSSREALGKALSQLNASIPALYTQHAASYKTLFSESTSIQTPDNALNEAFQWGIASIEQLKAQVPTFQSSNLKPGNDLNSPNPASSPATVPEVAPEVALVAGYYASGDSARPGFGWFFGRDSLFTLYAVNSYGDFALTRAELAFLIARQRDDGKIMHEFAQTAADPSVHWRDFDYMYAAADATPLFLMAMRDYYRASGDKAFLEAYKAAIEKAWAFETAPTSDTDHDGIYDNSQGTGWTESWHGDPHQEVYLALLDEQASQAYAALQSILGNPSAAQTASTRAAKIKTTIESEYYDPAKSCYAFSLNPDGSQDKATTIYPAIAWWDSNPSASDENADAPSLSQSHRDKDGTATPSTGQASTVGRGFIPGNNTHQPNGVLTPEASPLAHPETCLQQFASPTLATDWGLRDVATTESFYDGMSYHQGSVWPLFTGWGALAEYRANQPLPAQQMLMQNVDLTWAQDPGAVTELLSGDFFVPFGRSTSHQLWSSAMVITPTLRGLFGINLDATTNTITVNPHLPANWNSAEVNNLRIGDHKANLTFRRVAGHLEVAIASSDGKDISAILLRSDMSSAKSASPKGGGILILPLPTLEVSLPEHQLPDPGSRTSQVKVLSTKYTSNSLTLSLQALPGAHISLPIQANRPGVPKLSHTGPVEAEILVMDPLKTTPKGKVTPAEGLGVRRALSLKFPETGQGYQTTEITLTW